jgi:hypothetical protein
MDFVERLLGIWPDGGDGTFELLLFAFLLIAVLSAKARASRTQRTASRG